MLALGEWRDRPQYFPMGLDGLKRSQLPQNLSYDRLRMHLDYLVSANFVNRGKALAIGSYELTAKGSVYLQPELAEFGKSSIFPAVVESIENQIQILTYPQEEKDGMIFRLREAVAKQAPDFVAEVLVKIFAKMSAGQIGGV